MKENKILQQHRYIMKMTVQFLEIAMFQFTLPLIFCVFRPV